MEPPALPLQLVCPLVLSAPVAPAPATLFRAVAFCLLWWSCAALAQTASVNLNGRVIQQVDFVPAAQPMTRAELLELLPLRIGSPLKASDVRESLQLLYNTGRYTDVTIDAEPVGSNGSDAGIALRISTQQALFISGVSITGIADPPNRNNLLNAAKLELGAPFNASLMEQSVANMQERLRANGLYQAGIEYKLLPEPATGEMRIRFELTPGPRAHFDGVHLGGQFALPQPTVIHSTRWQHGFGPIPFPGWREATESRVQEGLNRVRNLFLTEDRLQSRATLSSLDYHMSSNTVTPALQIDEGPVIEVKTVGAKVSRTRLRALIPVYEERSVDQGLLGEGARNLVDYFQSQGYFEVSVQHSETQDSPQHQTIAYNIVRNSRHRLAAIEISGNKFFDTETLRERVALRESQKLRFRYGRYSPKLRDQDRDLIRELYRSNGFRDAKVTATTLDDYMGRQDDLGVRFAIEEGQPWFISKLQIDGAAPDDVEYLKGVLQSSAGQTFSDSNLSADRDTVLSYYFNNGYPNAAFDWVQEPSTEPKRVELRYVIRPGERQFVRQVLVRGLETTRPELVQSRLGLHAGDPISQAKISATQQKLYELGIFSRVQSALQNPTGVETQKNLLLQIDEANRYSFNFGFGAELGSIGGGVTTLDSPAGTTGFSPRVSAGISRLNLWGLGHTANLQARVSNFQQRVVQSYVVPQFTGDPDLSLTFSALFDSSRDTRTFSARRWEGSIQIARKLSRASTLQARVSYRKVTVDKNTLNIQPLLIPLLSQDDKVGIFSLSYIQDRRDNALDSRRGIYNTVDAGVSLPQFGSASSFTRLLLRNSTYHALSREVVLARTLQFGYQQRLAGLASIPLAERFFAGGASSQRAFPDNQAGPRDITTGFPLGGSALLFHSTELRFPLIGDNIGGVVFHDMGNVYSQISNLSFRAVQRNNQDFDYMVHAVGFGIRYRTPIGPVRVDFSYSPNAPNFFGFQGTREELLSNKGTLNNQKISAFQFHFSLGQTF